VWWPLGLEIRQVRTSSEEQKKQKEEGKALVLHLNKRKRLFIHCPTVRRRHRSHWAIVPLAAPLLLRPWCPGGVLSRPAPPPFHRSDKGFKARLDTICQTKGDKGKLHGDELLPKLQSRRREGGRVPWRGTRRGRRWPAVQQRWVNTLNVHRIRRAGETQKTDGRHWRVQHRTTHIRHRSDERTAFPFSIALVGGTSVDQIRY
jgi:hypothetical protein